MKKLSKWGTSDDLVSSRLFEHGTRASHHLFTIALAMLGTDYW
jgi:hypothetical protein